MKRDYLTFAELQKRWGNMETADVHRLIVSCELMPTISYSGLAYVWEGDIPEQVDFPFVHLEWPEERGPLRYSFEWGSKVKAPYEVGAVQKIRFADKSIDQDYIEANACFFTQHVENCERGLLSATHAGSNPKRIADSLIELVMPVVTSRLEVLLPEESHGNSSFKGGTPVERGIEFERRFQELKASGCKKPLVILEKETNLSRSRINQLRKAARTEQMPADSLTGMLNKISKKK